jgi:hypothetical protein
MAGWRGAGEGDAMTWWRPLLRGGLYGLVIGIAGTSSAVEPGKFILLLLALIATDALLGARLGARD